MSNKNKPVLSIGMIVKNEERCLERCLKALQPLRDKVDCELVIADTGSTDKTKEIAGKYSDILFDFEWIDDFAAARNSVLDKCSGKWFFMVDADEYLDEKSVNEICKFFKNKNHKNIDCAYIEIRNYDNIDDYNSYSAFPSARFLNFKIGIKFEGRVHEKIDDTRIKNIYEFKNVVLWHDGYLKTDDYYKKNKGNRNMELLEKELEEDPENSLRYLQAIESSRTKEEQTKYIYKAIDRLQKDAKKDDMVEAAIYRHAVYFAWSYKLPEYKKWLSYILNKYPDCAYTQIDVRYAQICMADEKADYKTVIEQGQKYLEILSKPLSPKMLADLQFSILNWGTDKEKENVNILMAKAYLYTGEYEKAKDILKNNDLFDMSSEYSDVWLSICYLLWDKVDLSDLFININNKISNIDHNKKQDLIKKEKFEQKALQQFCYNPPKDEISPKIPAYELISKLGDCDLAYAAKIMLSNSTDEITENINKILDWNKVPANVYNKILENNAVLPKKFYTLCADDIEKIAANIINNKKFTLDIIKNNDNPKDIIFNYYLINYQIHIIDWENNQDRKYNDEIILKFINISDKLLKLYYNDNILCEEMIDVLPNIHAFSWLIIKYNQDKQNKNFEKCVYWLKKAIKTLPDMNKMVKYLLDDVQNDIKKQEIPKEVAPELMMLAEKVKTILSQYPENDPAVLAIKQSDIYKKVAYIIEN